MKRKVLAVSILAMAAMGGYVGSYLAIRVAKPEFLTTNDGPGDSFTRFYYPLCYISADKPAWHSRARDGWLEIQIDWINVGNGYLYFLWDGHEDRAGLAADLHDFKEDDLVLAHFRYELETWDDFSSRIVPCIDMVKAAQQAAAADEWRAREGPRR